MDKEIPLRTPLNALISFHYFRKYDVKSLADAGMRLIGDSGAYSAMSTGAAIDIDEFLEWGRKWYSDLAWVAALDVIGDAEASYTNYRYLRDRGLDAVPTLHYGCDPAEMDKYAAEGVDFMGLGGMVGRKSEQQRLMRWTVSMFRYARDNHPGMRFHGWGVTHNQLIMALPWYSVDSSGFTSAYRFGRLALFNPKTGKNVTMQLDGKEAYKHSDFIRTEYGINPDRIAVSTPATRHDLVRLSVKSVQKTEDFLRKRHNVTPPTYGSMTHSGPNIHVVDAAVKHLQIAAAGPHIHVVPAARPTSLDPMTAKETAA